MTRPRPRPKRIRCSCCCRLMAFEPYKRGDAIRRPAPAANVCLDCDPIDRCDWEDIALIRSEMARDPDARPYDVPPDGSVCLQRGCKPASAIDKLAALAREGQR